MTEHFPQLVQMFYIYEPNYQSSLESALIRNSLIAMLRSHKISVVHQRDDFILDGGTVVDNDHDKAVVTTRIFKDNPDYTRQEV